jgi:transcriptional regulator with XRE-family HTH domain
MGKAGQALREVLNAYSISQTHLAIQLGVNRPIIFRWFHEQVDPSAERVTEIVKAIQAINSEAAREFIELYLGDLTTNQTPRLMKVDSEELPRSEQVNVVVLSRLFLDCTTSSKYLFFLSLLEILKRRQFEVFSSISFQEIIVEILANAWYSHIFFNLSFGIHDKIAQKLDSLNLDITEPILHYFTDTDKKLLRKSIASQDLSDAISYFKRYIPFRLIALFLDPELKANNIRKGRGNDLEKAMPAIAEKYFDIKKPLYKFDAIDYKNCQSLFIHPDWATYLAKNYSIIRNWVLFEWIRYLQQYNVNTPNLVNKVFMPYYQQRGSLSPQTKYWKQILEVQPINCIYSRQYLDSKNMCLDHYLPWPFVAHDQLWNVIPVDFSITSSKSNCLPSEKYFRDFVKLQHFGLKVSYEIMSYKKWLNTVQSYIVNLKMDNPNDLLDLEKLNKAYELTIQPLMSLATIQGFNPDWLYD